MSSPIGRDTSVAGSTATVNIREYRGHDSGEKRGAAKDASVTTVTRGRLRRRKRGAPSTTFRDEEQLPTFFDSSIAYDEYEEDDTIFEWAQPKREKHTSTASTSRVVTALLAAGRKGGGHKSGGTKGAGKKGERRAGGRRGTSRQRTMSGKTRKASEREPASSIAVETERIREQLIKDMLEEIRLEKYNTEEQVMSEELEASTRRIQLERTSSALNQHREAFNRYMAELEEEESWQRYMTCDGLPDPDTLSDMNTFMYVRTMEDEEASMFTVQKHCEIVTFLLARLNEIIQLPATRGARYIEECKEVRQEFRRKLLEWIDIACYNLLRQIERNMVAEDMRTARYIHSSSQMICCIWALIRLPIGLKQVAEKDRKPVEVEFREIDLTVKMPADVDCHCMAIRGMSIKYDHYSDEGVSYAMPKLPAGFQGATKDTDLLGYCDNERTTRQKIREEQADGRRLRLQEKRAILERMGHPIHPSTLPAPSSSSVPLSSVARAEKRTPAGRHGKKAGSHHGRAKKADAPTDVEPLPYLPTPDEIIIQQEEEARKEMRRCLFTRCEKTEVNLRKYRILGGVIHIDLLYQPPQPKDMRREILLTMLQIPKELKRVPFSRPYKAPPPAPDSERTPEVIEAEMKALESAMEALVLVTLKLPDTVLWFEPPLVAHWIPEKSIWSTQDVHDIKYNEEKQTITFRTGRLGIHGLAAYRFINLPFQSWELKPEVGRTGKGGVTLSITAATVQADFVVREDSVCLNSFVGCPSGSLKDILGEYTKLHVLMERMRNGGCDMFPEADAHSYVKGLPAKHPVAEKHLQECMGLLCTAYTFSWSRWNATRSPREIVLQFKELHGCVAKEKTTMTLLVTPRRTMTVQCTEVSGEFNDAPTDGSNAKFYADLYHLALNNAGIKSRLLMQNVSFKLTRTVTSLLQFTNVISMSS